MNNDMTISEFLTKCERFQGGGLRETKKKLIDDTKRSIEFLAASTFVVNGDNQGTKSIDSMLDSKEQFAHLCAAIAGNEMLMREVHKAFSKKSEADSILRKFTDIVTHPAIEEALKAEKGVAVATISSLSQSNEEIRDLMEERGIDSDGEYIFSATNIKFATYVQNGIIKEIAPETEISEKQLDILVKKIVEDGLSDRGDIDFICKKENLNQKQADYVAKAFHN